MSRIKINFKSGGKELPPPPENLIALLALNNCIYRKLQLICNMRIIPWQRPEKRLDSRRFR